MPTRPEKLESVSRLGIIAGSGILPSVLLQACDRKGIFPFIVAFEGHTDPAIVIGREYMWARFGGSGTTMRVLRSHDIRDLVFIGGIRRPSIAALRPDFKTMQFLVRTGLGMLGGDNSVLSAVRRMVEKEGFKMHGVHKFADDLLTPKGQIGNLAPSESDWVDIRLGIKESQDLGRRDIGQAVIMHGGRVMGREDRHGTDALIKSCKNNNERTGVLVKTCKPQQDRDMDLPAIGPETVLNAAEAGLAGIAVHAGASLLIDRQRLAEIADRHKMFVVGIDPADESLNS
jgi:UDP-2,3-diacylglucosamine hydrolase